MPGIDLELRLELADPPTGGCQLCPLSRRQARDRTPVDLFLAASEQRSVPRPKGWSSQNALLEGIGVDAADQGRFAGRAVQAT
jgi:hypothetical protein